ncbi:MAG: PTS sugar transporter subunit IIA [Treponema sp.]|nr:PTS sugar transporter subunit IIA [Treponema sp.]
MSDFETTVDIAELIHRGGIFFDVEGETPQEIYKNFSTMISLPEGMTSEQIESALCAREAVLSTAVGNGIALPHARAPIMKEEVSQRICVLYLKKPIPMKAPDERDVHVMFVLLTHNSQIHLKVLSVLAGLFRSVRFRKALENNAGEAELSSLIRELA